MLIGIDISHHNRYMKNKADLKTLDFVLMKATEGKKFKDPAMKEFISSLDKDQLRGFYHYGRPELGNTPESEAFHFIDTVKPYLNGRSILALDIEGAALNFQDLDNWCCVWMQVVFLSTGVLPMLYCSVAECKRFSGVRALSCGLWAAKWSKNKPTQKQMQPWDFWAIWQYTNQNIFSGVRTDADLFNGSREQFLKYAEIKDDGTTV